MRQPQGDARMERDPADSFGIRQVFLPFKSIRALICEGRRCMARKQARFGKNRLNGPKRMRPPQ